MMSATTRPSILRVMGEEGNHSTSSIAAQLRLDGKLSLPLLARVAEKRIRYDLKAGNRVPETIAAMTVDEKMDLGAVVLVKDELQAMRRVGLVERALPRGSKPMYWRLGKKAAA